MQHPAALSRVGAAIACLLLHGAAAVRILRGTTTTDSRSAKTFVRDLDHKHTLRICNAYPSTEALSIYIAKARIIEEPLPYKQCGEAPVDLHAGDQIDFKVQDSETVGTFTISELPAGNAVLMMVIFRHDTLSTAVSFESHIFAQQSGAQVAVVDTYRGRANTTIRIQDATAPPAGLRSELLRFDSVVAIDPGHYEVLLGAGQSGNATNGTAPAVKVPLVAAPAESYVVVRCGLQAEAGHSYPEELLIYPPAPPGQSAAVSPRPWSAAVLVAILAAAARGTSM